MSPSNHLPFHRSSGFTLIELLLVMTVLGVLSALAGPVMADITAKHRIDLLRSELTQSLQESRVEAVTRNTTVTLLRTTTCATPLEDDKDWSCGWIAFVDLDGDRIQDPGEILLQSVSLPPGLKLSKQTSPTDAQQFNALGQSVALGQRFELRPSDSRFASLSGSLCFSTGTRFRYKPGTGSC